METEPRNPTRKGASETFTGDVWADDLAKGQEPSRVRVSAVHFSPGARSAWHSHSLGQTLYVIEGVGLVQSRGDDDVTTLRAGDVVVTPAGEWHWHGAAPDHFMTHLSITEEAVGSGQPKTEWGPKVTDAEYRRL
jgi:quercetin dioxygenase-like cupin family protein